MLEAANVETGTALAVPGLVPTSTSETPGHPSPEEACLLVSRRDSRLKHMRRAVITSARLHRDECPRHRPAMLTLTYRDGVDWSPRHISELLTHIRKWCRRRGHDLRYTWVAELTKRRRIHYHIVLFLPRGLTLPKPDKQGWWKHGSTRIEWARHAVGYIAKYASKGTDELDAFPRGVRIHGTGGLSDGARNERCWWLSPSYIRQTWSMEDRPRRAAGGGWVARATGEWLPSAYTLAAFVPGGVVVVQNWCPLPVRLGQQGDYVGVVAAG